VQPSESADRLWGVLYKVLLAGWIISDSEGRTGISRPFCFGFLLLFFGYLYAPYYLLRTRGGAGLLWIAGGVALLFAGYLVPLIVRGAS
jgi:hypothetical protein